MGERPIRIVFSWCGSDEVSRDAWADWDVERQECVLGTVFNAGFCHQCECDSKLTDLALTSGATA